MQDDKGVTKAMQGGAFVPGNALQGAHKLSWTLAARMMRSLEIMNHVTIQHAMDH